MKKWEYKIISVGKYPGLSDEKCLNFWGGEGWEICTSVPSYVIMKREKTDES